MIFKKLSTWEKLVEVFNFGMENLRLSENFKCAEFIDLSLTAATPLKLGHSLKRAPRHRTITKCSANSTFIDTNWTENDVTITASANCVINIIYFL